MIDSFRDFVEGSIPFTFHSVYDSYFTSFLLENFETFILPHVSNFSSKSMLFCILRLV